MPAEPSTNIPRIVLITSGITPVAENFTALPANPVGIINWNNSPTSESSPPVKSNIKHKLRALVRRRQYANLPHLCAENSLLYADIYKRDLEKLTATLAQWSCNLVVTSRCSLVPTAALSGLSHGAINLHPSWLPDYRGAEPLLWQIAENQEFIAASIHRLTDEYDKGSVLAQEKMPRPSGTGKGALLHIADVDLGSALLIDVISRLTENPHTEGIQQDKDSETRYASRETSDSFGERIPLDTLSDQTVWDLVHYFGHCPMPWLTNLGLTGWRTKVRWQPVQFDTQTNPASNGNWSIAHSRSNIQLSSETARMRLKPVVSSLHKLIV